MGRPESVMREAKTVFLFYLTDDNLDNHLFVEWHKKNNRISRENKLDRLPSEMKLIP
jgi:hypothetical protein